MQTEARILKWMGVFVLAYAALGFLYAPQHHELLTKLAASGVLALALSVVFA